MLSLWAKETAGSKTLKQEGTWVSGTSSPGRMECRQQASESAVHSVGGQG